MLKLRRELAILPHGFKALELKKTIRIEVVALTVVFGLPADMLPVFGIV
jgi:hypothetical protein